MALRILRLVLVAACSLCACSGNDPLTISLDFRQSDPGWRPGFADYPVGEDAFYELNAEYRPLPAPLTELGSGLFSVGVNRSDDLWMYYKGRVAGFPPEMSYAVRFEAEIASNAPSGCFGVGGSPGESVTVKVGVSELEPARIASAGFWRMNIDIGSQSTGGANALAVGDMATSIPCEEPPVWELKELSSGASSLQVTTDGNGAVWLLIGTDSGFESTTEVYFTRVTAIFEPR